MRSGPELAGGRVFAVAASAGGLRALIAVLSHLPSAFDAPVVVVLHLAAHRRSWLAEILDRQTALHVKQAEDGEPLRRGWVYVAPPDAHVVIGADETLSLSHAAPSAFVRPAANVLFHSLAEQLGPRSVAVVLTGTGHDGAAGVLDVSGAGGHVVVQDKASSEHFGMPGAALATGVVDEIIPLCDMAEAMTRLCEPVG